MTVSSETNRIEYAGDDSTVAFPTTFNFALDGDLKVVLVSTTGTETVQTITTHYTVTGAGSDSGGTVTMVTAPATGEELVIIRDVAATQGADYVENDTFPSETHEDALDKLTYLVQQLKTQQERSLQLADGETDAVVDMVLPVDVAGYVNKLLGFDSAGKAVLYDLATEAVAPFSGALVYKSAAQSIANNTETALTWDLEEYDTDSIHDTDSNTSRLVVPAGVSRVRLQCAVQWASNATGRRQLRFYKNNSTFLFRGNRWDDILALSGTFTHAEIMSAVISVAPGDYFEALVYQSSGGALDLNQGSSGSRTWFSMEIIE